MNEQVAATLIVEASGKSITVTLNHPMTLHEVWNRFSFPGRQHPICTLSKGVVRVTF